MVAMWDVAWNSYLPSNPLPDIPIFHWILYLTFLSSIESFTWHSYLPSNPLPDIPIFHWILYLTFLSSIESFTWHSCLPLNPLPDIPVFHWILYLTFLSSIESFTWHSCLPLHLSSSKTHSPLSQLNSSSPQTSRLSSNISPLMELILKVQCWTYASFNPLTTPLCNKKLSRAQNSMSWFN